MNDIDTPAEDPAPSPHPLARDFAARITEQHAPRVLVVGYGSGRNVPLILGTGARVEIVEEDAARAESAAARYAGDRRVRVVRAAGRATGGDCSGALSTHALLHGTRLNIAAAIATIRARLRSGAPFFLTLGSKRDPRYGSGRHVEGDSYAPIDGPEAGITHTYFDERGVRALLRDFTLETLSEGDASATAGTWAHDARDAATLRHWFVRARTNEDDGQ